ncbi:MAG: FG-GAP-like repeat-containing protein, partial [Fidelibacterota bacterium]
VTNKTLIFKTRCKTSNSDGGAWGIWGNNNDGLILFNLNSQTGIFAQVREGTSNNAYTSINLNYENSLTNWHEYKIVCTSSNVMFFIDDTLQTTITQNIPINKPLRIRLDRVSWGQDQYVTIDYVEVQSSDGTVPVTPTGLTATLGNQQITLKWNQNTESDFAKYIIYGGTSSSPTTKVDSTTSISDTTKTITGLTSGTTYYYRITAVDNAGNESGYSNEVNTIPYAPPTIISFSPSFGYVGNAITITGTNFSTTSSSNTVYFGPVKAVVTSATSTQLTVIVPNGTNYQPITVTTNNLTAYSNKPFGIKYGSSGSIISSSFALKVDFSTGSEPYQISGGDLDGDGKVDLVIPNYASNTLSVLRNTSSSGSISFATKVDFSTGLDPYDVAISDLDGDGKLDIVSPNGNSHTISVYRNTSTSGTINSSSFAAKVDYNVGTAPYTVAIGDLDLNGKPDLIITNRTDNSISVIENTSMSGTINTSSFATKVDFTTGADPLVVKVGDIDGDGKLDIIVTNNDDNTLSVFRNTSTTGIINTSSFSTKVDFSTGSGPSGLAIGDIDGDGKPDVAISYSNGSSISIFRNVSTSGSINAASFETKVDFSTGNGPLRLSIGELDGDGKPDIATGNYGSDNVSVLKNTSVSGTIISSSFASKVDFSTGIDPISVFIADIDGDGKQDMAVNNYGVASNSVSVFRNINTDIAPSVPSNLTATPGNQQITLKWNQNAESDFAKYIIYGGSSSSPTTKVDSTTSISDTTKTITGLTSGTTYYYRITAVDNAGNESGYSNEVNATPNSITDGLVAYYPFNG